MKEKISGGTSAKKYPAKKKSGTPAKRTPSRSGRPATENAAKWSSSSKPRMGAKEAEILKKIGGFYGGTSSASGTRELGSADTMERRGAKRRAATYKAINTVRRTGGK